MDRLKNSKVLFLEDNKEFGKNTTELLYIYFEKVYLVDNIKEAQQIIDDYKKAAPQINLPEKTNVVIMTTDVASDVRGLLGVLDNPFPFIGVMGSENKISEIKKQLKAEGIADQQLSRITAPVGLPMVSNTPEEIAISIAAQLLQLRDENSN